MFQVPAVRARMSEIESLEKPRGEAAFLLRSGLYNDCRSTAMLILILTANEAFCKGVPTAMELQ